MTFEYVLRQWASSITTDPSTSERSIPATADAAKLPEMTGYAKCVLDGTTSTTATYPFKVTFKAADGSEYTVDLSTDQAAGSGSGTSRTDETASGTFIPVNNTLLKDLVSGNWVVGASAAFETARSGGNVW